MAAHYHRFEARHAANALWAVATIGVRPPQSYLRSLALGAWRRFPRFLPQHFSLCVVALARLGFVPSRQWLKEFFAASAPRLAQFKPQARRAVC